MRDPKNNVLKLIVPLKVFVYTTKDHFERDLKMICLEIGGVWRSHEGELRTLVSVILSSGTDILDLYSDLKGVPVLLGRLLTCLCR